MDYIFGIDQLRQYLRSHKMEEQLYALESLSLQLIIAQEAYSRFRGPASREELFMALDALTRLSLETTGENLQYWCEYREVSREGKIDHAETRDAFYSLKNAIVLLERDNSRRQTATGFFIHPAKHYLFTCNHFLAESIECYAHVGSQPHLCTLIRRSEDLDIALIQLKFDPAATVTHIPRPSKEAEIQVNDHVICVGRRPQGYLATRNAFVSSIFVVLPDYHVKVPIAELDTNIHPGFSGSPMFDQQMKDIVGISMARVIERGGVMEPSTAIMLPIVYLIQWMDRIEKEVGHVIWEH